MTDPSKQPAHQAWSMRVPALLPFAVAHHTVQRLIKDTVACERGLLRLASTQELVPPDSQLVYAHQSRLHRSGVDVDRALQRGKVENLLLASRAFQGLVVRPGETMSVWHRIGPPLRRRGFVDGMELRQGRPARGVGGGLCQIANVLHWLVLHSPLRVVERSIHSFDPFPDQGRSLPWGIGCALFHPYRDLRVINETAFSFWFDLRVSQHTLDGELRSDIRLPHAYSIVARDERYVRDRDGWRRQNELWRLVRDRATGRPLHEEHIARNDARVLYAPPADRIATG